MNSIEKLRTEILNDMFQLSSLTNVWADWKVVISTCIQPQSATGNELIDLGNKLYDVFRSTGANDRSQSSVSAGGAAWECLVCWYLNLCCLGSNTVIVKAKKKHIPSQITDAITVKYGTTPSNTESDLLAITFPDGVSYGQGFATVAAAVGHLEGVIDANFDKTELTVIQCKTNWNDNAQVPMLWDLIYSSQGFTTGASVGSNGRTIRGLQRFSYAFATVPTVEPAKFKANSTAVLRVCRISGGNYWSLPSKPQIAQNIFELIHKNFPNVFHGSSGSWTTNIGTLIAQDASSNNTFRLN